MEISKYETYVVVNKDGKKVEADRGDLMKIACVWIDGINETIEDNMEEWTYPIYWEGVSEIIEEYMGCSIEVEDKMTATEKFNYLTS